MKKIFLSILMIISLFSLFINKSLSISAAVSPTITAIKEDIEDFIISEGVNRFLTYNVLFELALDSSYDMDCQDSNYNEFLKIKNFYNNESTQFKNNLLSFCNSCFKLKDNLAYNSVVRWQSESGWSSYNGDWYDYYEKYNCYAYALGFSGINNVNYSRDPGFTSNSLINNMTLEDMVRNIYADLSTLEYNTFNEYEVMPIIFDKNASVICLKKSNGDYHLMKYDYYTKSWYHKQSVNAPLKRTSSIYSDWEAEICKDEGVETYFFNNMFEAYQGESPYCYNSDIVFITYQGNTITVSPYSNGETISFNTYDVFTNNNTNYYSKLLKINIEEDGLYTFNFSTNSSSSFSMYDSLVNKAVEWGNVDLVGFDIYNNTPMNIYLERGSYNILFESTMQNNYTSVSVSPNYTFQRTTLGANNTNNISDKMYYIGNGEIEGRFNLNITDEGYYYFSLNETNGFNTTFNNPTNNFTIKDSNNNLINKMGNAGGIATNNYNNNLLVYLEEGVYTIDLDLPNYEYEELTLKIEELKPDKALFHDLDIFNFENSNQEIVYINELTNLGDFYILLNLKQSMSLNLEFELENSLNSQYLFIYDLDNETIIMDLVLNNQCSYYNYTDDLSNGHYLIGFLNKNDSDSVYVSISRNISVYSTSMFVDPPTSGVYSSEINIYEDGYSAHSYGDTFIHEGFTRIIFLEANAPSQSRLDYEFYTSNPNVSLVTDYGTVLALSVEQNTSIEILIVYKDNPTITYHKTFTILNDINQTDIDIYLEYNFTSNNLNRYDLTLNSIDVPYPYLQYYSFNNNVANIYVDSFGRAYTNIPGTYVISADYQLNQRVHLYVTINII